MKCSHCGTEIEMTFCPKCGQEFRNQPLTLLAVLKDYFNSFFSLDGSLLVDVRQIFLVPKQYIFNYWNGFRRGQSSPNRVLVLSTLFVGLALIASEESEFLGWQMKLENFSAPLFLLLLLLPALTLASYLAYFVKRRTLAEHLVLNCYVLGTWLIVLSPISAAIELLGWTWLNPILRIALATTPFIWAGRVFHEKWWKTALFMLLHLGICTLFVVGLAYGLKSMSKT